jgi:hypothetical protein
MEKRDDPRESDKQPAAKRPYEKPRLTVYGDLRLRTLAMGGGNFADGGVHPTNKTG